MSKLANAVVHSATQPLYSGGLAIAIDLPLPSKLSIRANIVSSRPRIPNEMRQVRFLEYRDGFQNRYKLDPIYLFMLTITIYFSQLPQ